MANVELIQSLIERVRTRLNEKNIKLESTAEFENNNNSNNNISLQLVDRLVQRENSDLAFYVINVATVVRKYEQWVRLLPRVEPFYAMKCNPDDVVVEALAAIGTGFDCASIAEIDHALRVGAAPEDIIYANPCKQKSGIEFARSKGVRKMTFDNIAELYKIHAIFPEAQLVVRIKPPTEQSVMSFSRKFGSSTDSALKLVNEASKLGIAVVGVSFHVGSGCYDVAAYTRTLDEARKVFDEGERLGMTMNFLDIGGGFPGTDDKEGSLGSQDISFPRIAEHVRVYLDQLFPREKVRIISEPGRYFVAESSVLVTNVLGRRDRVAEGECACEPDLDTPADTYSASDLSAPLAKDSKFLYYIADGVYGSFNAIIFDHMHVHPNVLASTYHGNMDKTFKSICFGPTCDSMDVVCRNVSLPELQIGDWLYFENMGAYTRAAGSEFNGIPLPARYYYLA